MGDNPNEELEPTPETQEETPAEESGETPVEENQPESEDIEFNEALEEKPQRSELDKAKFTARSVLARIGELGGDPAEVIAEHAGKGKPEQDIDARIDRKFAEQDVRKLSRSEAEFKAIMSWVNKGLSVEDAHLLANKGKIKRSVEEIVRANEARPGQGAGAGERVPQKKEMRQSAEAEARLAQRGLKLNPKTGTYRGQFTEEYFDGTSWQSRKIQ